MGSEFLTIKTTAPRYAFSPTGTMRVRDLIQDTIWLPGHRDTTPSPIVTVLLPSYRREDDRFFQEAVQSVLNQTLTSLELIIIDDASIEHTDNYIQRIMEADARVSCLKHRNNIGLPAISEFEGFVRARGQYLAFGFDDFIFQDDALFELVKAAEERPKCAVHGYAQWFDLAGREHFYGKDAALDEELKFHNFLANGSFLVPRSILQHVGLYDPHIAASRLCDWDLWRRIRRKYPIISVPVLVGREYGATRQDSLEHTYPLFEEAMQEYFSMDRDVALRPENYEDFDVWQLPNSSSPLLTAHVIKLRSFFKHSRGWTTDLEIEKQAPSVAAPGPATVAIYGSLNLMTSLIFGALPRCADYNLLYIPPERDDSYLNCCLAGCSALILVSHIFGKRREHVKRICSLLEIPLYYMPEHNINLTPSKADIADLCVTNGMASLVDDFDGVLCSSDVMARALRKHWPMGNVYEVGPIIDTDKRAKFGLVKADDCKDLRVAVLLGSLPNDELAAALERVGQRTCIRLLTPVGIEWRDLAIPLTLVDNTLSSDDSLVHWRQLRPDIIVSLADDGEMSLGNHSALLLVAHYLGSIPVLSARDGFYGLGERDGVLRADGSVQSYEDAILCASDPATRARLLQALDDYCSRTFTPERTHRALTEILGNGASLDATGLIGRLRTLVIETSGRALSAEARAAASEHEFSERLNAMNNLLAAKDLELQSRSYRLALKIRMCANRLRAVLRRLPLG